MTACSGSGRGPIPDGRKRSRSCANYLYRRMHRPPMSEERNIVIDAPDGEHECTFSEVKEMADNGHPAAMLAVALCYLEGHGVEEDLDLGYAYLEKAVDAGDPEAKCMMVDLFLKGDYIGIDTDTAVRYAIEASKAGVPEAHVFAGLAYMDGVSVPQDYAEAARLFRLAANRGDNEARASLAYMVQNGLGMEKDEAKAFKMFRTAANGGNLNAIFQTGVCCEYGTGTPIDIEAAKGWYSKGSDLGDAECRYRLGLLMIVDDGTDDKDGFEKILSAALEGCTEAAYATGRCYLRGIGTDADVSEAKKWLKLAADAGLKDAQDDLDSMESDD